MDAAHSEQQTPEQSKFSNLHRKHLADAGQEQLVLLLQTSKALLDAYSNIQPAADSQQRLQQLQRAYLQVFEDVRQTLLQCQALEQQEAAIAAAEAAGTGPDEQQQLQQLQARAANLRQQLQHANQLIKQVIDKLRHLADAFNMWESHERNLVQSSVQFAVTGLGQI